MKVRHTKITVLTTLILGVFSCKKKDLIALTGINLNPPSLMSYVGASDTFKAVLSPSNASGSITWSSGNPAIATVGRSGVVTCVATGTTTITAKTGNDLTATCTVTITKWATFPYNLYEVTGMTIDAAGNKWISTFSDGIWQFDGAHWITYNTSNSGLAGNAISPVAIDMRGNKWIGTGNGVSEFDGTRWTTYNTANSKLASNTVNILAIDAQNNIWFCTQYGLTELYAQ